MALAMRIEGAEVVPLSTLWRDTTSRGAKELAETLEIKKALGVPQRQIFRELGYSDPEIDQMLDEALEATRARETEGLGISTPPVVGSRPGAAIIGAAATAGPS